MKLHHTKYKQNIINYLLDENDTTPKEIIERFENEYGWCIERKGRRVAMIEWLSGLALMMPCYNNEIIDFAIEMGSIDENPTERQKDKIIENYFPFMANIILTMEV
jgi:hypothetical protein